MFQLACWLCRSNLLEGSTSSSSPAQETDTTAGLENRELLQLQQRVMDDQDAELAELEKTVTSTKVRAATIAAYQTVCRRQYLCAQMASAHPCLAVVVPSALAKPCSIAVVQVLHPPIWRFLPFLPDSQVLPRATCRHTSSAPPTWLTIRQPCTLAAVYLYVSGYVYCSTLR